MIIDNSIDHTLNLMVNAVIWLIRRIKYMESNDVNSGKLNENSEDMEKPIQEENVNHEEDSSQQDSHGTKEQNEQGQSKPSVWKMTREWIYYIAAALIASYLFITFVATQTKVISGSMEDTLMTGQTFLVNKLAYNFHEPKRKDIVVFVHTEGTPSFLPSLRNTPVIKKLIPKKDEVDYIKRIIGLPNDLIDIKDGFIYINGKKLDEPYVKGLTFEDPLGVSFPYKVPPNRYFMMGDNRLFSTDSRRFGTIHKNQITGKAIWRTLPINQFGRIYKNSSGN